MLDLGAHAPYIAAAMNRIILALLALFAGLVSEVVPAQARMAGLGDAEIGAVEYVRGGTRQAADQIAGVQAAPAPRSKGQGDVRGPRPQPRPPVYIPTVQFGADRAYE